jgi:hypothetical protein
MRRVAPSSSLKISAIRRFGEENFFLGLGKATLFPARRPFTGGFG